MMQYKYILNNYNDKKVVIVYIILLSLSGCNFWQKTYPTYDISDAVKEFIDFKVGSFWVFIDSSSNNVDTVYLSYYDNFYEEENDKNKMIEFKYENIITIYKKPADNSVNLSAYAWEGGNTIYYHEKNDDYNTYLVIDFDQHGEIEEHEGYENYEIQEMLDSILISETWYRNVYYLMSLTLISDQKWTNYYEVKEELWMAKKIGVIKKRFRFDTVCYTYDMIDYNVIQ